MKNRLNFDSICVEYFERKKRIEMKTTTKQKKLRNQNKKAIIGPRYLWIVQPQMVRFWPDMI